MDDPLSDNLFAFAAQVVFLPQLDCNHWENGQDDKQKETGCPTDTHIGPLKQRAPGVQVRELNAWRRHRAIVQAQGGPGLRRREPREGDYACRPAPRNVIRWVIVNRS